MSIIGLLIALLVFSCCFYLGYYIITKCFPEPMRVVALAVLGVVFLIILLSYAGGYIPGSSHGVLIR